MPKELRHNENQESYMSPHDSLEKRDVLYLFCQNCGCAWKYDPDTGKAVSAAIPPLDYFP